MGSSLLRSRTTLFASFSGKRRAALDRFGIIWGNSNGSVRSLLGARPQTPRVGFAEFRCPWSSAKQNNAFASFSGQRAELDQFGRCMVQPKTGHGHTTISKALWFR
jgi:hypothetical protein